MFRPRSLVVAILAFSLTLSLHAGELRIPLPKKSKYTPVQKLNREGVAAVQHHQYDKAKKLFYQAYLIDPNDPFTLNNLGYMAEIEGEGDRAQRFYELAANQNSEAVIDRASNDLFEGKPLSAVAGAAGQIGVNVNRLNMQAIELLQKDRAPEADLVLQQALKIDPKNPFTLNNLGYAREREGEFESADRYYRASANLHSPERIEVAIYREWRGRAISDIARNNAEKLERRITEGDDMPARVARLNLRGVSAFNRNDRRAAREFIEQAYKLDPNNAFTLNNMGFFAELDGDRETADYYYARSREADEHNAKIALATKKAVEGQRIDDLAGDTDQMVLAKIESTRVARQQQGGPVELMLRDHKAVVEPSTTPSGPKEYVSDENGVLKLPPLPSENTNQPAAIAQPNNNNGNSGNGGLMMPLPENEQPPAAKQPENAQPNNSLPQGDNNGGLLMPLPDNEQPPEARQPSDSQPSPSSQPAPVANPAPANPAPANSAPGNAPAAKPAPAQPPANNNPPLLLPPPDSQQPPAQAQPKSQNNATTAPAQPSHISDWDKSQTQKKKKKKETSKPPQTNTVPQISDEPQ